MRWLPEIICGGVGSLYLFLGEVLPEPTITNELVKTLGPGLVGIAALYLCLRHTSSEGEKNRECLRVLAESLNKVHDIVITCPARQEKKE